MSLYQLSKMLFNLNRDDGLKVRFKAEPEALVAEYDLTEEERGVIYR